MKAGKRKFSLYVGKFPVDPKLYFKVQDTLNVNKVSLIKEPIVNSPIYKINVETIDYTKPIKPEVIGHEDKKSILVFFMTARSNHR